jgi:hypothetical protein
LATTQTAFPVLQADFNRRSLAAEVDFSLHNTSIGRLDVMLAAVAVSSLHRAHGMRKATSRRLLALTLLSVSAAFFSAHFSKLPHALLVQQEQKHE